TLCMFLILIFIALNIVAFNHAWSMTHFAKDGVKTPSPESLSLIQKVKVSFVGINIPRPENYTDPRSLGLEFENHKFVGKDGVDLEAWHIPHPKATGLVLMIHGYASCKANLLPEAKVFHDLGYATFLLDFRGSGGSS